MSSVCSNIAKSSDYPQTPRTYALLSASMISTLALVVILSLGAAGSLSMNALGYSAIGLAAGSAVLGTLPNTDIKKLRWTSMIFAAQAAVVIALAALGITGILSAKIVGVASLCSIIGVNILGGVVRRCDPKEKERLDKLKLHYETELKRQKRQVGFF